jgi:NAD(P)-dependent dehydrogenase (short-subunit alcohol dehydrogenase family)
MPDTLPGASKVSVSGSGTKKLSDPPASRARSGRPHPTPGRGGARCRFLISWQLIRRRVSRIQRQVVHVSSIAGQTSPLPVPMYNATKHAINGLVRSLAPLEARLGIRVAAVAPGVVKTPLWTEHAEKIKAVGAKDAWVTPEEVAEVMVALVDKDEMGNVASELDKGQKISN